MKKRALQCKLSTAYDDFKQIAHDRKLIKIWIFCLVQEYSNNLPDLELIQD